MTNATTSIYPARVTTELAVISCYKCGIVWGQPKEFDRECRRKGPAMTFYCPNGHGQCYIESEATRLQRELDSARGDTAFWREQYAAEQRSLSATKGHLTRLRRRAEAGVCIHCNRTFQNVARHMETKHVEARNEQ